MFISCENEIDNVENLNNPDRTKVLANGSDLIGIVNGGFVTWWQANNRDLMPALAVAADASTCSWGNYGMRSLSSEPRNPILNATSWSDLTVLSQPWGGNYSAIATSNDIINAIAKDIKWVEGDVDKTPIVESVTYFLRGLSYGYLGLLFEKGFIVDEETDVTATLPFVSYKGLITQSLKDLDKAIDLADAKFEIPNTTINGVLISNTDLIKICKSYKARFIVQSARNMEETDAIDWQNIKTLASAGITEDFGPNGDDGKSWWSRSNILTNSPNGFGKFGARVDMRLIKLVDSSQPEFFPGTSGSILDSPEITTDDARFGEGKDFEYQATVLFRSERGRFHFSHYINTRYENDMNFSDGSDSKQMKTFTLEDNRLLLAEAKARLGELTDAVVDVNLSSRVTRGELTPLESSVTKTEIMNAIFYERYIELYNTATGGAFFDRRRTNQLQVGTFRHFPIPANELEVLEEGLYTLGGLTADPTGIVPHYLITSVPERTDDTVLPTFN